MNPFNILKVCKTTIANYFAVLGGSLFCFIAFAAPDPAMVAQGRIDILQQEFNQTRQALYNIAAKMRVEKDQTELIEASKQASRLQEDLKSLTSELRRMGVSPVFKPLEVKKETGGSISSAVKVSAAQSTKKTIDTWDVFGDLMPIPLD